MADRSTITLPPKSGPAAAPEPPPAGEDITYLPGDGDPHTVKWRGQEFKANTPVRVTNESLIEAALLSRFFRVGSSDPTKAPAGSPKTAMEYRAHVVDWIKDCEMVDQVATHWAADRQFRVTCEVGQDDISFLGTLVEPKLKALRMKEGLTDAQVAAVWIKHGVLDLPWRS
jgi:hypothetical protein